MTKTTETTETTEFVWPDEVSVLKADDLLWAWSNSEGQGDLLYWLSRVFNPDDLPSSPEQDEATRVLVDVLRERFTDADFDGLWMFLEYAERNRYPSFAFQAACWNEMLDRLGYDIEAELREIEE